METVAQLRALIATVDAALLSAEDRMALIDLFDRSHHAALSLESVSDGPAAQLV